MKYLLDRNIFSRSLKNNVYQRRDLCITQDVIDECGLSKQETKKIKDLYLQVIKYRSVHYEKLKIVLECHGDNMKLINLFLGEGTADVMMIAFILAEMDEDRSLFPEQYTIVTKDLELTKVATSYGIACAIDIQ